jgi:hypothetical protein
MSSKSNTKTRCATLRAVGEKTPKGPVRSLRLPIDLDDLVEGRTNAATDRAAVLLDLIRKGLRYERLRQAKDDPVLGELIAALDGILAARLSEALAVSHRHLSVEFHILRELLGEILTDARVASRAAERLLTGRLFLSAPGEDSDALNAFISECENEAGAVLDEIKEERENEMRYALNPTTSEVSRSAGDSELP